MKLLLVAPTFIDKAWKDGAHMLSEACEESGGEITIDQLKLLLTRGERHLLVAERDGQRVGWGVVRFDQLPNVRVMHVCEMYAPGASFEDFYPELKEIAQGQGCSEIRCAAKPAQARLYKQKVGFEPIYQMMRIRV